MNISIINGAIVFDPTTKNTADLTPGDFADKAVAVTNEPAFYVALDVNGLLARSVSVTVEDRKTVAALVGNWIAEGFQPLPCDIKKYAKYVRDLVAANKPAAPAPTVKTEGGDNAPTGGDTGGAPAEGAATPAAGGAAAAPAAAEGGDGI